MVLFFYIKIIGILNVRRFKTNKKKQKNKKIRKRSIIHDAYCR